MNRRGFLKNLVAGGVTAALGLKLPESESPFEELIIEINPEVAGQQLARALARSMVQTREIVARNILSRAFEKEWQKSASELEEIFNE